MQSLQQRSKKKKVDEKLYRDYFATRKYSLMDVPEILIIVIRKYDNELEKISKKKEMLLLMQK